MAATETYPDGLKYHKEHDWARIEADEAVLGITWFAQDSLGELVHSDPYGDGWLVRIRITDPAEADALLDAEAYKQVVAES